MRRALVRRHPAGRDARGADVSAPVACAVGILLGVGLTILEFGLGSTRDCGMAMVRYSPPVGPMTPQAPGQWDGVLPATTGVTDFLHSTSTSNIPGVVTCRHSDGTPTACQFEFSP